jgi:hypothetical protein
MARGRPKLMETFVMEVAAGRSEPDEGETTVSGFTRDDLMEAVDRWWEASGLSLRYKRWSNIDATKARRGIEEALLAKMRDGTIVRRYRFIVRDVPINGNRPEMGTRQQFVRYYEYFSRDAIQYIPPADSPYVGPLEFGEQ